MNYTSQAAAGTPRILESLLHNRIQEFLLSFPPLMKKKNNEIEQTTLEDKKEKRKSVLRIALVSNAPRSVYKDAILLFDATTVST